MCPRAWLRRLYEALYPKHHNIGSLHILSLESVPELTQGRRIIAVWIQDFLNRLYPDRGVAHAFLVNLMRTTRLAMLIDSLASGVDMFTTSNVNGEEINEMELVLDDKLQPSHLVKQTFTFTTTNTTEASPMMTILPGTKPIPAEVYYSMLSTNNGTPAVAILYELDSFMAEIDISRLLNAVPNRQVVITSSGCRSLVHQEASVRPLWLVRPASSCDAQPAA